MLAFEVYLNDTQLCTAGVDADGVLTSILSWIKRSDPPSGECELEVGGLESSSQEHLRWVACPVSCGQEIRIKIRDADSVDEAPYRRAINPEDNVEKQKKYVLDMTSKFGWAIQMGDTAQGDSANG